MVYYNHGKPTQVEIFKREYQPNGNYVFVGKTTVRIRDIKRIESTTETTEYGTPLSRVMFKSGGSVLILDTDADELSRYM